MKTLKPHEANYELTKREIYDAAIATIPLVDIDIPIEFPVPLKNAVFIRQITGQDGEKMKRTEGGIIMVDNITSKVVAPCIGIVMAVGIDCSPYLRPGHKVIYNRYAEEIIMIYGQEYLRLNEATDIYGILPPESWIVPKQKGDRWLFREKRKQEFEDYQGRKDRFDANKLDQTTELEKKIKGSGIKGTKLILPGSMGEA
jgi:co-chaperonin GroES (HSP10)